MVQNKSLGEGFVTKSWIKDLTWKQQTVLLTAIRGCDNRPVTDPAKPIIREYRSIILHDAVPKENTDNGFMHKFTQEEREKFIDTVEEYPTHWFTHFLHAVEIVGYKHPDKDIRERWNKLYNSLCENVLHVNPERERQLNERLEDG